MISNTNSTNSSSSSIDPSQLLLASLNARGVSARGYIKGLNTVKAAHRAAEAGQGETEATNDLVAALAEINLSVEGWNAMIRDLIPSIAHYATIDPTYIEDYAGVVA